MKRACAVCCSLVVTFVFAQQTPKDGRTRIGTWRLVEFADLDKDGKWVYWFGEHPRGYIVYDATGHMHIQIMKVPPLVPFPESNWDVGTPPSAEHAVAAYQSYEAYFGTYTVDDANNVVTHHVEGSVHPDYTDSEQARPFSLDGDRLEIGDGKTYRRVLERVSQIQAQAATETKSSAAHSERDRFVGAWQSVSITDMRPDGTEVPDLYLGPHPTGMLIYNASGFVCGGNMNPDRKKWTNPSKGTREELAAAAEGYDSYCGTYSVDPEKKRIIHHVQISLDPNMIGVDLERTYAFDGERLKLSGTEGLLPGFKFWTFTFVRPNALGVN
jgi:hypothetical protein